MKPKITTPKFCPDLTAETADETVIWSPTSHKLFQNDQVRHIDAGVYKHLKLMPHTFEVDQERYSLF